MAVDRDLWQRPMTEGVPPGWPCPNCKANSLSIIDGSIKRQPSALCHEYSAIPDWTPEYECGAFSLLLKCSRQDCKEGVAVTGSYNVAIEADESHQFLAVYFHPKAIYPPPPIIVVPKDCPKNMSNDLVVAFSLFWIDCRACLNRLRNVLELLLTHMKIKRFGVKKTGGRAIIALDSRIELLRSKRPHLADLCDRMLAVKHLGNAGSHPGDIRSDDVFDALDILEAILQESFAKQHSILAKQVKQINKRKGPRRRKR